MLVLGVNVTGDWTVEGSNVIGPEVKVPDPTTVVCADVGDVCTNDPAADATDGPTTMVAAAIEKIARPTPIRWTTDRIVMGETEYES